jgi:hypothetical protein
MSFRKFCSATLPERHSLQYLASPNCEHHWFDDFRVNHKRYRNTTETANKQDAKSSKPRNDRASWTDAMASVRSRTSRSGRSRTAI